MQNHGIHFHICRHQYRVLYNFEDLHTIGNLHQHMHKFMTKDHQVEVYEDMTNLDFKQINIDELEEVPHSYKRGTILPARKKNAKASQNPNILVVVQREARKDI